MKRARLGYLVLLIPSFLYFLAYHLHLDAVMPTQYIPIYMWIYALVALPLLLFSGAGLATLIYRQRHQNKIEQSLRRVFFLAGSAFFVGYLLLVAFMFSRHTPTLLLFLAAHPILHVLAGVLLSMGIKAEQNIF